MGTFHDPNMYSYQANHIRKNECYSCSGTKRVVIDRDSYATGMCEHCKGTGEATDEDRERLAVHDKGICLICKLPYVKGHEEDADSKYSPSGVNDCLDHLRQYVFRLEIRIKDLE